MDSANPAQRGHRPRLTRDLVALLARRVEDAGPPPDIIVHDDEDYEASLQALLAKRAWSGQDVWVFGYGSLLWKPDFEVAEQVPAVLHGWRRHFCVRITRFRGTPEQPGLMMSLVPGGSCRGAVLRIAGERVLENLRKLWRREMTVKPPNAPPRWVSVKAGPQSVPAIAFVADRHGRNYVSGLAPERIAEVLCSAVGHWGSGAEYLMQTVDELDRLGIRDMNLWRLQELVAQRLIEMRPARQHAQRST